MEINGLTNCDYECLLKINEGLRTQNEIYKNTQMAGHTVFLSVNKLIERGLVKAEIQGRKKNLTLTAAGKEIIKLLKKLGEIK